MGSNSSLEKFSDKAPFQSVSTFSLKHRLIRVTWNIVWISCASWTPKFMRPWRIALLRLFGAKIGKSVDVRGSAKVWYPPNLIMKDYSIIAESVICYNMNIITIHERTVISQRVHLCAGDHDIRQSQLPLITRPIEIGPDAWVAAEAFIGPGSVVTEGCVVGARAVVFKRLEPWSVYAGNPALRVSSRQFK